MTEQNETPHTPDQSHGTEVPPQEGDHGTTEQGQDNGQDTPQEGDLDQLPDWARAQISKANDEAAKRRRELRDLQQAQEAQQAKQEQFREKMLAALGITPEGEQQTDPDALVKSVTEERDQTMQELNALREQVAVNNAATKAGVDPDVALRFLRGGNDLADLDPTADDYNARVAEKVTAVAEAYPGMRTQVVPKSSGDAPTPTNSGNHKVTREDLANMPAEDIHRLAGEGKLNHLL